MRIELKDAGGRRVDIALLSDLHRTIRVTASDGDRIIVCGDAVGLNTVADMLRRYPDDDHALYAGRFLVDVARPSDIGGYIDWATDGPSVKLHPNKRGGPMTWLVLPYTEVEDDLARLVEAQRPSG
ncbi:MAG: hypothetical protein LC749_02345 [Actinobacteria bacterium]|nr:hypothetical protein [Actinomycetota bacterium]